MQQSDKIEKNLDLDFLQQPTTVETSEIVSLGDVEIPVAKIPIETLRVWAQEEVNEAIMRLTQEFLPDPNEKLKRPLDRALMNIAFVNYILDDCPSLVEYLSRSENMINLIPIKKSYKIAGMTVLKLAYQGSSISIYAQGDWVETSIRDAKAHGIYMDGGVIYNKIEATAETIQSAWDNSSKDGKDQRSEAILDLAELTPEDIYKRILQAIETKEQ